MKFLVLKSERSSPKSSASGPTVQSLGNRISIALLLILCGSGCGQTSRDLELDQPGARTACTTFLTAWKDGKKSEDLQPAIIGRDYAWEQGFKLVEFELLPEEVNDGTNLHIPVRLTLQKEMGTESVSEVVYVVGTSPVVTVFRE